MNRNLITSENQLFQFIDSYNSKLTLYYSLYSPSLKVDNKCNCEIAIDHYHFCYITNLDKVCFDIDEINSLESIKKMHLKLLQVNLKHLILFSGQRGFHLYIFTKNYENLKNPKLHIVSAQNKLLEVMGRNKREIDMQVFGENEVSRMMRVPNTMHIDSHLYCIPLTTEDLVLGKNHILTKSKQQNFKFIYYGTEFFDISQLLSIKQELTVKCEMPKIEVSIDKKAIFDIFPPCQQINITRAYVKWHHRAQIVNYLKYRGYSDFEIDKIMEIFLKGKKHPEKGVDNYLHFKKERQLQYLRRNKSLFSCKKIKSFGECPVSGLCQMIKEKPLYY